MVDGLQGAVIFPLFLLFRRRYTLMLQVWSKHRGRSSHGEPMFLEIEMDASS